MASLLSTAGTVPPQAPVSKAPQTLDFTKYGRPEWYGIETHISGLAQPLIVVEVYPESFPKSCANFQMLVEAGAYNGNAIPHIEEDVRVSVSGSDTDFLWGDADHAILPNTNLTGRSAFPGEPTYDPKDDGMMMPHAWHELIAFDTQDGQAGIGSRIYFTHAEVRDLDAVVDGVRTGGHPFGRMLSNTPSFGKMAWDLIERCVEATTGTAFKAVGITRIYKIESWGKEDEGIYNTTIVPAALQEKVKDPRPYDDLPDAELSVEDAKRAAYDSKPATEYRTTFDDNVIYPFRNPSNIKDGDGVPARFHTGTGGPDTNSERLLGNKNAASINRVPRVTLHRVARYCNLFTDKPDPAFDYEAMRNARNLMEFDSLFGRELLLWMVEVGQDTDFTHALYELLRAAIILNIPSLFTIVDNWSRFIMRPAEYEEAIRLATGRDERPVILRAMIVSGDGEMVTLMHTFPACALRNCRLWEDFIMDPSTEYYDVAGLTSADNFNALVSYLERFADNTNPVNLEFKPFTKVIDKLVYPIVDGVEQVVAYEDQPLRLARIALAQNVSSWELAFVKSIHSRGGLALFEMLQVARNLRLRSLKNLIWAYITTYFLDVVWENDLEQRARTLWERCQYDIMVKRSLENFYRVMGVPVGVNPFESAEEEEGVRAALLIHDDENMRADDYAYQKPEDHTYHPPIPPSGGGGGGGGDDVEMSSS